MNWYRARLYRRWPCGNYKVMDYYLQQPDLDEARRHVQKRHGKWRLLSLVQVPCCEAVVAEE